MQFKLASGKSLAASGRRVARILFYVLLAATLLSFGALHDLISPPPQNGPSLQYQKHHPGQPVDINQLFQRR